ncbi:MAG: FHA domain-containing protein [Candidatus Binataceae bacterium]
MAHDRPPRLVSIGVPQPNEQSLEKRKTTVGSGSDNDLRVIRASVSNHHAIVKRRFGRYRVADLNSTNGTYVNGRRISKSTLIAKGDELRVGDARFIFLDPPAPGRAHKSRFSPKTLLLFLFLLFVAGFGLTEYLISQSALNRLAQLEGRSAQRADGTPSPRPAVAKRIVPSSKATHVSGTTPTASALPLPANKEAAPVPDWLQRVNYWRASAKLPAASAATDLIPSLTAHAHYLVMNRNALQVGAAMHTEDPKLPGYSREGLTAAQHAGGDVIPPGPQMSGAQEIDAWIGIPFHRASILNRYLLHVGLGNYCERGICAAVLGCEFQQFWSASEEKEFPQPVEFPSDGSTLPKELRTIGGEWPDPLSGCPGYSSPAGQAISLQFDNRFIPKLATFSIARDGVASIETCGFDSTTYLNPDQFVQDWGRKVMTDDAEVVLVPRASLVPGATYSVTITVEGRHRPYPSWPTANGPWSTFAGQSKTYTWSFSVGR